jgi:hypothetical protein
MGQVQRFIFHADHLNVLRVGDRIRLGAGEETFVAEETGHAFSPCGIIRELRVGARIAEPFSPFVCDEPNPKLLVQPSDDVAEVSLDLGVRVDVGEMDNKAAGCLVLWLPRLDYLAPFGWDGKGAQVEAMEVKERRR